MSQYTSYYLYQKFEKRGDQDWLPVYPNVYSADGDGTMPPVIKQEDDSACGYTPPAEPQYRWVDLDPSVDYYCLDCGTDGVKISGTYGSGDTFSVNCDSSTTLTTDDVSAYYIGDASTGMTYLKIGSCITEIGTNTLSGKIVLTGVSIPNTVTTIGNSAFTSDIGLIDCSLPSSVTSIGKASFFGCIALNRFVLWDTVTSIGESAFTNCDSLISINIPSGLTTIPDSCFQNCGALIDINIPNNIQSIGEYSFASCSILHVKIGSGITSIAHNAFSWNHSLESITILATTPPTLGDWAFDGTNDCPIYVPAASLSAYQSAWSQYSSRIQSITS